MERFQKLELLQRSLGLRHKLKVHESIKTPETHDELALMLLSKWELEDELKAIDELLVDARNENVARKRTQIQKDYLGPNAKPLKYAVRPPEDDDTDEDENHKGSKKKSKK